MSAHQVSSVLSWATLPGPVQLPLLFAFPSSAEDLARNPSLFPEAWDVLYDGDPNVPVLTLLLNRPLPEPLWRRVASDLAAGRFPDGERRLVLDRALAWAWEDGLLRDLVPLLCERPGPALAAALLASGLPCLPEGHLLRSLRRRDRLALLLGRPDLCDDVVWDLLLAPDPDPGATSLDVRTRGSRLLFARPGLRARAASGPLLTLQMAVCVELDGPDQLVLVESCAARLGGVDDEYVDVLRALVAAPWCTLNAHARIERVLGPSSPPSVSSLPLRSARRRPAERLLRSLARLPLLPSSLLSAVQAYTLLELSRNPNLSTRARRRLALLLALPDCTRELGPLAVDALVSLGASRPPLLSPLQRSRPGPPAPCDLSLDEVLALLSASAPTAALALAFSSLPPDPKVWETALVLLGDGQDVLLGDLLQAAQLLSSSATSPAPGTLPV